MATLAQPFDEADLADIRKVIHTLADPPTVLTTESEDGRLYSFCNVCGELVVGADDAARAHDPRCTVPTARRLARKYPELVTVSSE